jgi:cobaltochelatase CobN
MSSIESSSAETDPSRRRPAPSWDAVRGRRLGSAAVDGIVLEVLGAANAGVSASLTFACREVVPRLRETSARSWMVLHALDGGFVPAGPSGSPLRGLVNVLPTGRNFYSVDPKAIPSPTGLSDRVRRWPTSLLERYRDETGELPDSRSGCPCGAPRRCAPPATTSPRCSRCSASSPCGTSSPAGSSDWRCRWPNSGRPRIDVTVRISGFFRDAFPHVIAMLDDAVALVAALDEPAEQNYVRAHARRRPGPPRGRAPRHHADLRLQAGSYGAGILQVNRVGQLAR